MWVILIKCSEKAILRVSKALMNTSDLGNSHELQIVKIPQYEFLWFAKPTLKTWKAHINHTTSKQESLKFQILNISQFMFNDDASSQFLVCL